MDREASVDLDVPLESIDLENQYYQLHRYLGGPSCVKVTGAFVPGAPIYKTPTPSLNSSSQSPK